ncbi:hypothetical protein F8M41_000536 [Gigaspora margarita]|uniref:TM7S3/TM198-like domain-containing protein n=2 Tax=Gigaspora margarita TaxID=4874 RepID=A0A8H3XHI1_GIGMA|nr:hypothetical protein F8M41_000536 [Gigaspora margarita]
MNSLILQLNRILHVKGILITLLYLTFMIIVVSASDSGESREGYYLGNDRPGEDIPQPPTLTDKDNPYVNITRGDDYPMDGASYLTGITLIITGLVNLIRGNKYKWLSIFLASFHGICVILMLFILKYQNVINPSSTVRFVYFIVSAGAGIAAGVFFVLLWPTGKILVGTLGGFSLAMILLSTRTDGLIFDQIWRWIFIGFFSISMSILAGLQKIYPYIAIISTVSSGCYGLMLGVDVFARTGLLASFKTFWGFTQPDDYRYVVDTHVIIILLSIGVLGGLFGIAIQLLELWIRQKNDRSKVEVDDDKETQDSIKLKSFRKKLTEKVHNPFKRN